jgi:hypothetical protein
MRTATKHMRKVQTEIPFPPRGVQLTLECGHVVYRRKWEANSALRRKVSCEQCALWESGRAKLVADAGKPQWEEFGFSA